MKKYVALALVAASAVVVSGCKSEEEKLVSLLEEKAEVIDKAGSDCDKIASALEDFNKSKGKDLKELQKKMKEKYKDNKEKEKELKEKYKDRLDKANKIIIGTVFKCHDNKAYEKAIKVED
jgi:5'-3' exonuclease